jgi:arylsulfatase A-like enzyme
MMQLDDEVGQVHAALKETGLDKNTLLIFTSDNGPGPYAARLMAESDHAAAGGLRGVKAEIWEGGHREPFIVKWPGKVPEGSTSDAVINFTDVFATLAEMLGVDVAETYPSVKDSESFFAQLTNPDQERTRSAMVNGSYSIRDGVWKLTSKKRMKKTSPAKLTTSQFGLYNLSVDLPETTDLSDKEPERVKALFQDLQEFETQRKLK